MSVPVTRVRLYVGVTLNLLAIICGVRQQNLELTSSLYRCNSMGASIPALDYREGFECICKLHIRHTFA